MSTRSVMLKDSAGCLPQEDFAQVSHGNLNYTYMANLVNKINKTAAENVQNSTNGGNISSADILPNLVDAVATFEPSRKNKTQETHYDTIFIDNGAEYIHVHYEHTFTCGKSSHQFNDMAMLWLNGGVKGVKVLMQRGFPHLIETRTLWVFFIAYFLLAAITAGTHVPAGLVVPLLLIGGSYGRLFGVYWMNFKTHLCDYYVDLDTVESIESHGPYLEGWETYNMYHWSTVYRWIIRDCKLPDPGTFAVIGMASFMGGSGRITVMLAIVMLELTGDAGMIAPVGLVCVFAMLVGNMFNHGLYHGLIPVMNIPFLNSQPSHVMYVTRVVSVMSKDIHYLPQMVTPAELRAMKFRMSLDRNSKSYLSHNGFPVVRGDYDLNLIGLLNKSQLLNLLDDLDDPKKNHSILWKNGKVDLTMFCERSPISVLKTTTVSRAYEIFRKLGLRHLVVCGNNGSVEGILTRKDLMVYRIVQQKKRDLELIVKMQDTIRLGLKNRGFYNHSSANPNRRKSKARRMDRHLKRMHSKLKISGDFVFKNDGSVQF